jgi:hypothetical protein
MEKTKETNPKDAIGITKAPLSTVSGPVMFELGLAMLEGALKYGRHNYRVVGVRTSVYYDALMRHIISFWEGEDIDPDSGIPHITKAIATLVVLRDAQIHNNVVDDRPPASPEGWIKEFNAMVKELRSKYPEPKEPYVQKVDPKKYTLEFNKAIDLWEIKTPDGRRLETWIVEGNAEKRLKELNNE